MPYKKRYYKKRNSRPGYKACGSMVVSDARKALAMAASLKRLINVEVKNFDVQQTNVTVANSVQIIQLSNIPQGDTTITRDGAQLKMIGYQFNYSITQSSNATSATHFRIMLVLDKQTNQAIYASTDLFEDASGSDAIVSPRNLDNKRRFQVLYDRVHTFSASGSNGVTSKKYISKDILFRYDASTPSIADLTQNSLSLVQFSTEDTNTPTITFFGRMRYVDN